MGRAQSLGASAQGATLSWDSTNIFYQPANNNNDSFTYTVSNGSGTATGMVTVMVAPVGGLAKTITASVGGAIFQFFGIPGLPHDVQRTTSLRTSPLAPGAGGSFPNTDGSARRHRLLPPRATRKPVPPPILALASDAGLRAAQRRPRNQRLRPFAPRFAQKTKPRRAAGWAGGMTSRLHFGQSRCLRRRSRPMRVSSERE